MTGPLVVAPRFCGPPGTGNGGYVCGSVAAHLRGVVTVTLRRPVPLDTPLAVEPDGEASVRLLDGATLIAQASSSPGWTAPQTPGTVPPADAVSMADADRVAGQARYYADPAFPDCFVCGMSRPPGDGLRIFPGPVAGWPVWAAPWTPDPSFADDDGTVRPEVVWAALDCPGGMAVSEAAGRGQDTAVLLGQMTAGLAALPRSGERYRVLAWPAGRDGRKLTAGSALVGPTGQVLATATAVWITVRR